MFFVVFIIPVVLSFSSPNLTVVHRALVCLYESCDKLSLSANQPIRKVLLDTRMMFKLSELCTSKNVDVALWARSVCYYIFEYVFVCFCRLSRQQKMMAWMPVEPSKPEEGTRWQRSRRRRMSNVRRSWNSSSSLRSTPSNYVCPYFVTSFM
jgi:hypothetical protein